VGVDWTTTQQFTVTQNVPFNGQTVSMSKEPSMDSKRLIRQSDLNKRSSFDVDSDKLWAPKGLACRI